MGFAYRHRFSVLGLFKNSSRFNNKSFRAFWNKKLRNKEKEEENIICKKCGRKALQGIIVNLHCPICEFQINRRDAKTSKRKLKCINTGCAGILESGEEKNYWYCEYCKEDEQSKANLNSEVNPEYFEKLRGENAEAIAKLDLVLVAPRHLFRMPYSLHEKTS